MTKLNDATEFQSVISKIITLRAMRRINEETAQGGDPLDLDLTEILRKETDYVCSMFAEMLNTDAKGMLQ